MSTDQESGTDLAVIQERAPVFFAGQRPGDIVAYAIEVANAIAPVIREQGLAVPMGGRDRDGKPNEHIMFEGWQIAGTMLGVYANTAYVGPMRNEEGQLIGFEASAEARTRDGAVVGTASAMCTQQEWKRRKDGSIFYPWVDASPNQMASMAQTRAAGKALRFALSFVVKLAGFSPTPAEEMESETQPEAKDTELQDAVAPEVARAKAKAARQRTRPMDRDPVLEPWDKFLERLGLTPVDAVQAIREEIPGALGPETPEETEEWPKVPETGEPHELEAARLNELQRAATKLTTLPPGQAIPAQQMLLRLKGRKR